MLSKGEGRVESYAATLEGVFLKSSHVKPKTWNLKLCPFGGAFKLLPKLLAKGFNSFSIHSEVGIPNPGSRSHMNHIFFFVEQKFDIINKSKNERSNFSMNIMAGV